MVAYLPRKPASVGGFSSLPVLLLAVLLLAAGLLAEKAIKTADLILSLHWAYKWNSPCLQNALNFYSMTQSLCIMEHSVVKLSAIQSSIHISLWS